MQNRLKRRRRTGEVFAFRVVEAARLALERAEIVMLFGISETDSTQIEKVSLFYVGIVQVEQQREVPLLVQPASELRGVGKQLAVP